MRETLLEAHRQNASALERLASERRLIERGLTRLHAETLASGLAALPDDIDGAVICLGDMPWIGAAVIDSLIDGFDGQGICLPTHRGRRGNPVLWARRYFSEMQAIEGDKGARGLIEQYEDVVHEVPWDDDSVLRDIDTSRDAYDPSGP